MLKAYMAYEGPNNWDGCLLVFAETRNQARHFFCETWWSSDGIEYVDTHAVRTPEFDKYAMGARTSAIWTNNELPEGVVFYSVECD